MQRGVANPPKRLENQDMENSRRGHADWRFAVTAEIIFDTNWGGTPWTMTQ